MSVFAPALVVGVDPGIDGAYAVLDADGSAAVFDLPVIETIIGKQKRKDLDAAGFASALGSFGNVVDHVFIERVAARPEQGVSSTFRFGYAAGVITGVVTALQIPRSFVTPQTWQKAVHAGPSPDVARQRACDLYPALADRFATKSSEHRADALLIAHYGMQVLLQQIGKAAA